MCSRGRDSTPAAHAAPGCDSAQRDPDRITLQFTPDLSALSLTDRDALTLSLSLSLTLTRVSRRHTLLRAHDTNSTESMYAYALCQCAPSLSSLVSLSLSVRHWPGASRPVCPHTQSHTYTTRLACRSRSSPHLGPLAARGRAAAPITPTSATRATSSGAACASAPSHTRAVRAART